MHGLSGEGDVEGPVGREGTRHGRTSRRRRRASRSERVRLGSFDGLDGRGGSIVRAILVEVTSRLERAAHSLARERSLTEVLRDLDRPATTEARETRPTTLALLLDELALALEALGQPVGARAARKALLTASRLTLARARRLNPRKLHRDPELLAEVCALFSGRLPSGFDDLLAVSTVLA